MWHFISIEIFIINSRISPCWVPIIISRLIIQVLILFYYLILLFYLFPEGSAVVSVDVHCWNYSSKVNIICRSPLILLSRCNRSIFSLSSSWRSHERWLKLSSIALLDNWIYRCCCSICNNIIVSTSIGCICIIIDWVLLHVFIKVFQLISIYSWLIVLPRCRNDLFWILFWEHVFNECWWKRCSTE